MPELIATFVWALALMLLVMSAGWLVQRHEDQPAWSDVFWTFGVGTAGMACALTPLEGLPAPLVRRGLIAALCGIWSLRLGLHIAVRTAGGGQDARYAQMREQFGAGFQRHMLGFMLIQAPIGAALAGVVMIAAHAPGAPGLWDAASGAILALAIAGEGLADRQLARFKADPQNRGQICDAGLWARSRHPNYFFEWLIWLAYPLSALNYGLDRPWVWASLAGPVLMYLLLTRVSGVPPLERSMLASRGDAYRAYQARVPAFFPRLKLGA